MKVLQNPKKLVCPYGCEFSADPADYFNAVPGHVFTCPHKGKDLPCMLIERIPVEGVDELGRDYSGFHWTVLADPATIEDLRRFDE
jgi:hypothetical protein